MQVQSTRIATLPTSLWNTWIHVAFCRIGSTVNVYANGTLVSQSTGVTTDFNSTNVGANGVWFFTGPTGDRDESYFYNLGCTWRNMRYTVGNNVYGNVSSFTPPPLTQNIAAVTGTQYIFWPAATTNMTTNPVPADYATVTYDITRANGSGTGQYPYTNLTAYPSGQTVLPADILEFGYNKGTWTNNGTAPNQPKISTTGPAAIFGNSIGDFTATGTNVRISSTDSSMADMSKSFFMYIWFYIPATITNEKKTIIAVETTDGFVLNIGRAGQGLDWLSISAFGGSELAYGQKIWARNAWNFLCVQKKFEGSPGPIAAWAGALGDNYAANLNLIDTGGAAFAFASAGNVSIGCESGSTVSSQMYFNQIMVFNSGSSGSGDIQTGIYPSNAATIPVFRLATFDYYQSGMATAFDFQGTNGNTNIQPTLPT
jgi:hypothetical protein